MNRRAKYNQRLLRIVAEGESFKDSRESEFGIGDVVRLNSGGPLMMIVDIDPFGEIVVSWRDQEADVKEASLPAACVHRTHIV
jgi:uncharacterized protein YodC (DUF2158 family)